MELTPEQAALIGAWYAASNAFKAAQEEERKLRAELVKQLCLPEMEKGIARFICPLDWVLEVTKSLDYKLENSNGELDDVLKEFPDAVADMLVRWKPELSVRNYEQLAPEHKAKFNAVLSIKPGTPSVKLLPPKPAKG
jgi:hypothetical protein